MEDTYYFKSYYFKFDASAGMAHDSETGENAECFSKVTMEFAEVVNEEHAQTIYPKIIKMLSTQTSVPEELISAITKEEYEENADDDE